VPDSLPILIAVGVVGNRNSSPRRLVKLNVDLERGTPRVIEAMAKVSSGLGDGGFIAATVVIDSVTSEVVGGPTVSAKEFSEDPEAFEPVVTLITEALDRSAPDEITDPHQLHVRYRRRHMIVPTVVGV
jgi:hypothetical protein